MKTAERMWQRYWHDRNTQTLKRKRRWRRRLYCISASGKCPEDSSWADSRSHFLDPSLFFSNLNSQSSCLWVSFRLSACLFYITHSSHSTDVALTMVTSHLHVLDPLDILRFHQNPSLCLVILCHITLFHQRPLTHSPGYLPIFGQSSILACFSLSLVFFLLFLCPWYSSRSLLGLLAPSSHDHPYTGDHDSPLTMAFCHSQKKWFPVRPTSPCVPGHCSPPRLHALLLLCLLSHDPPPVPLGATYSGTSSFLIVPEVRHMLFFPGVDFYFALASQLQHHFLKEDIPDP